MKKSISIILAIITVFALTACSKTNNEEITEKITSDIFENNSVVELTYTSETKIDNGIPIRNISSGCEKELDRIIHKNTEDILADKILYSKNNFDELGFEYMKELGFNSNSYNDYAIVLSINTNSVETYMVLQNNLDDNTNINILNEWKKQLKDIYLFTDEEKKVDLYNLLDNTIIKVENGYIYFFTSTDTRILEKI